MRHWTTGKAARVVMAAGVVASAATIGLVGLPVTYAGLTSSKANHSNGSTAGTLQVTTSSTSAWIVVTNARPGTDYSNSGSLLTITNSGSLPATETLKFSNISHSPSSPDLSALLTISVKDITTGNYVVGGSGTTESATAISSLSASPYALPGTTGAQWRTAPNGVHQFLITVHFPSTQDNTYQGTSAGFDMSWGGTS